ncbi:MAG: hypothetical protein CVU56_24450 [Deltaproteobacteria bacterium HGW-Deltaproteobacteria-14]|nr:MAG: hypothetical protein CVU56_24450 [Deltaproteobacteria bacterium HGW-Deltaproteobacteria-14]
MAACCIAASCGDDGAASDASDASDIAGDAEDGTAADEVTEDEFATVVARYDLLSTVAGLGEDRVDGVNDWLPAFEGGPATAAELSRPHVAMADVAGVIYIADKNAHAIRRVATDGTITTAAGTGEAGDDGDLPGPGVARRLSAPNGLWVRPDGVVYVLDLGNSKVRRLGADGALTTLVFDAEGMEDGRGLWVSDDEQLAYWASGERVRRWRAGIGVDSYASGFAELGNLAVAADGALFVTDRAANLVYRVVDGGRTVVAGNGEETGGGDGALATATGLAGVRGIAFMDTGGMLLATHLGSQVWYVDTAGVIHLFLDGDPDAHGGDGQFFRNPGKKVAEVRAVTIAPNGDVLVTESDYGFVRRVRHR